MLSLVHYQGNKSAHVSCHQIYRIGLTFLNPIVAAKMSPEPTKERVELKMPHSARFTLLFLLRILRYMGLISSPHELELNSDRNLDLHKIWFSDLNFCLQYDIWFGFGFKKHNSLHLEKTRTKIWGRLPWSPCANTTRNHNNVSICFALLAPQWKAKSQV